MHFSQKGLPKSETDENFGTRCVYYMHILILFNLNMLRPYIGIFDLEHVKVIWVIWFTFLTKGDNSKTAHRRAKRIKLWASGVYVVCVWVLLTLDMSSSFWGHLAHFSKNWAITRKWLIVERNG